MKYIKNEDGVEFITPLIAIVVISLLVFGGFKLFNHLF